jgi:hypothetical protein
MRIKSYLEFINESEMDEFSGLTALPGPEAANIFYKTTDPVLNAPKVSLVKKVKKDEKGDYTTLSGALRIKGSKGTKDYTIFVDAPLMEFNVVPRYLTKTDGGYTLTTNKDQKQELSTKDMDSIIAKYKEGSNKFTLKAKLGTVDIIFTSTDKFKDVA